MFTLSELLLPFPCRHLIDSELGCVRNNPHPINRRALWAMALTQKRHTRSLEDRASRAELSLRRSPLPLPVLVSPWVHTHSATFLEAEEYCLLLRTLNCQREKIMWTWNWNILSGLARASGRASSRDTALFLPGPFAWTRNLPTQRNPWDNAQDLKQN